MPNTINLRRVIDGTNDGAIRGRVKGGRVKGGRVNKIGYNASI
ncbi:MAG: hypothetical protein WBH99_13220 [Azovibrio sp.]